MSLFDTTHCLYTILMAFASKEEGCKWEKWIRYREECLFREMLSGRLTPITHKPFSLCLSPNVLSKENKKQKTLVTKLSL